MLPVAGSVANDSTAPFGPAVYGVHVVPSQLATFDVAAPLALMNAPPAQSVPPDHISALTLPTGEKAVPTPVPSALKPAPGVYLATLLAATPPMWSKTPPM